VLRLALHRLSYLLTFHGTAIPGILRVGKEVTIEIEAQATRAS
jgi:hypothetical protein